MKEILEQLKKTKFKKQIFGGINEADVWKKIEELNSLYEKKFNEQEIKYKTLLKEKERQNE